MSEFAKPILMADYSEASAMYRDCLPESVHDQLSGARGFVWGMPVGLLLWSAVVLTAVQLAWF